MPEISPPRRGKKTLPEIHAKRGSDETKTYEERVLEEEVYALLIKAIQNLPEQCQKVYLLCFRRQKQSRDCLSTPTKHRNRQIPQAGRKKLLYDQLKHIIPSGFSFSYWNFRQPHPIICVCPFTIYSLPLLLNT